MTHPPEYCDRKNVCLDDLKKPVYVHNPSATMCGWEGDVRVPGTCVRLADLEPQAQHVAYGFLRELRDLRQQMQQAQNLAEGRRWLPRLTAPFRWTRERWHRFRDWLGMKIISTPMIVDLDDDDYD